MNKKIMVIKKNYQGLEFGGLLLHMEKFQWFPEPSKSHCHLNNHHLNLYILHPLHLCCYSHQLYIFSATLASLMEASVHLNICLSEIIAKSTNLSNHLKILPF